MGGPAAVQVTEAAEAARPWIVRLARLGYAAKGIVYVLVGWIAARSAMGDGETTGSHGALEFLLGKPFGKSMLALLAVGLAGYALWRAVQAIADPEHKGTEPKGLAVRAYMLVSALIHAGLCVAAFRLATGDRRGGEEDAQDAAASLMAQPYGRWLVGLVGLLILAAAVQQFRLATGNSYRKHVRIDLLEPHVARWVGPLARLGLVSRGFVFLVVGGFLVAAALHAAPQEAKGVGEALGAVQQQPAGALLLLVVAVGLAAYGTYELVKARYRVIALPHFAASPRDPRPGTLDGPAARR